MKTIKNIIGKANETAAIASAEILPTYIASTILKPVCNNNARTIGMAVTNIVLVTLPVVRSFLIMKEKL